MRNRLRPLLAPTEPNLKTRSRRRQMIRFYLRGQIGLSLTNTLQEQRHRAGKKNRAHPLSFVAMKEKFTIISTISCFLPHKRLPAWPAGLGWKGESWGFFGVGKSAVLTCANPDHGQRDVRDTQFVKFETWKTSQKDGLQQRGCMQVSAMIHVCMILGRFGEIVFFFSFCVWRRGWGTF